MSETYSGPKLERKTRITSPVTLTLAVVAKFLYNILLFLFLRPTVKWNKFYLSGFVVYNPHNNTTINRVKNLLLILFHIPHNQRGSRYILQSYHQVHKFSPTGLWSTSCPGCTPRYPSWSCISPSHAQKVYSQTCHGNPSHPTCQSQAVLL